MDFVKLIEKIEEKQYSTTGLIYSWLLILLFVELSLPLIPLKLKDNDIFSWVLCVIVLIVGLLVTWIWYRKRCIPEFKPNEIGILVAFSSIEENLRYSKKLTEAITLQLQQELNIKCSVRPLPPNHTVKNKEDAVTIRSQSNAHLILWGTIDVGKDGEKGIAVKLQRDNFFLTFKNRAHIHPSFFHDTSVVFRREYTSYHEDNEIVEFSELKNNIARVAQFGLAKCLAVDNKYEEALKILGKLQKDKDLSSGVSRLISANMDFFRYSKIIYVYNTQIYNNGTFSKNDALIRELLDDISRISLFIPNLYILKASLHVLLLEFKKAEIVLEILCKRQTRQNSVNISFAFIQLWKNNIDKAQKLFYKVNFSDLIITNVNHILDFYNYFIETYPNRFCFLYGYAYINMQCRDPQLAIQYFNRFVEHKSNNLNHWKDQARKYIQRCKGNV